jgi:hypothetical protein
VLAHTDRTPVEMARYSLQMARRALAMLSDPDADSLVPHPIVTALAEMRQAARYLDLAHETSVDKNRECVS